MSLPINPDTKVGALLEAYPGIEEALIEWVPAFSKLKNPILRKTVAKVATLRQAASIGGVAVPDLVRKLREVAGEQSGPVIESDDPVDAPNTFAPAWVSDELVRHIVDAEALLSAGEHPIGAVRQSLARLEKGEIVVLTSRFRPEPLIEAMLAAGLEVYSIEPSPGCHRTYFSHL